MSSPRSPELSLRDLIAPLEPADFIERHLLGATHFLSETNSDLVDKLKAVDDLMNLERLVRRFETVSLFGPKGFRSQVPGTAAMDFYHRGDTLYLHNVQRKVPRAAAIFNPVADDLGVRTADISIEIFAARQDALSTLHYDHDTNFQILLRGTKRWTLQQNLHIVNPLLPNHRLAAPREEAFAERLPFPAALSDLEEPVELVTTPGTCLFFPIGYWHHVEASEDSFAVNLVLKPPRWVDAITAAARRKLLTQPALRAPFFGALTRADGPLKERALDMLAAALRLYADAVGSLSPDDVAWSVGDMTLRWGAKCQDRRVEESTEGMRLFCPGLTLTAFKVDPDFASVMRKLVTFRGSFTLWDLKQLAPSTPVKTLSAHTCFMKALSYFEEVDAAA